MERLAPTKANLISAKGSLKFTEKGFELLDKKRNVLINEIMNYANRARDIQHEMQDAMIKAYEELVKCSVSIGFYNVYNYAKELKIEDSFNIKFKKVMGVSLSSIVIDKTLKNNANIPTLASYFIEVKFLIYELAQIENNVFKLSNEIKKTQRRANALENIQIPKFIEIVKEITCVLEEKDREDFFRLKMVKKKKC